MQMQDYIGGRGESIAFTRLTQFRPDADIPYFWPHYLGEKCETFDFWVELVGAGGGRRSSSSRSNRRPRN
jgi:hypothetical protein